MKTVNELYRLYFNHNIIPSQAPRLWKVFNKAVEKTIPDYKLETPYYVELCDKYARPE